MHIRDRPEGIVTKWQRNKERRWNIWEKNEKQDGSRGQWPWFYAAQRSFQELGLYLRLLKEQWGHLFRQWKMQTRKTHRRNRSTRRPRQPQRILPSCRVKPLKSKRISQGSQPKTEKRLL